MKWNERKETAIGRNSYLYWTQKNLILRLDNLEQSMMHVVRFSRSAANQQGAEVSLLAAERVTDMGLGSYPDAETENAWT
jgi:hypothetical protein